MLKWTQNSKYYQDTEENLISRWFIRKELFGQVDSDIYTPLPRDWWYRDKAWLERPRKTDISGIII